MKRPVDPSQTIPVHAPDVNYPAGANNWSGTPTKQSHPGSPSVGLTPNTGVPAQVINRLIHDAYAMGQTLKDYDTAAMAWNGQMAALNIHEAGVAFTDFDLAKYKNGTWYFSSRGVNDRFARSDLLNASLPSTSEISGGNTTAQKHSDFDVDDSGRIVVIDDAIDGFKHYNGSTWAKVTGVLGHDTDKPNIVYEPVSGLWCIAGGLSGSAPKIWTSSNRTTWTARTAPSGMPTGGVATLGTNGLGRIVMVRHGGTTLHFAHSDDGGVTWSAASSSTGVPFTQGASAAFYWPKAVWNGSYWLLCSSTSAGSGSDGVVYKSTTGANNSWNLAASFVNDGIRYLACLGDLWLGLVDNLRLAMSVGGTTWKVLPISISLCSTIAAGGGRFVALGGTNDLIHYSHGMGWSDLKTAT